MDAVNVALQVAFIAHLRRGPGPLPAPASGGPSRPRPRLRLRGRAVRDPDCRPRLWPDLPRGISQLSAVILLLQPYLTLRLARHFVPVSRQIAGVALALVRDGGRRGRHRHAREPGADAASSSPISWPSRRSPRPSCCAASRYRVGYARTRLRIASAATFLFAAGIFVVGRRLGRGDRWRDGGPEHPRAGPAADAGRGDRLPRGLPAADGAAPPPAARGRVRHRPVAARLRRSTATRTRIWVALAQSARMVTNGPAAIVALGEPPIVRIVSGDAARRRSRVGQPYARSDGERHPRRRPDDDRRPDRIGARPAGLADRLPGRRARCSSTTTSSSCELLAAQAARANERREAIRQQGVLASELEDASQELATSRAQLESEARFRAALEAHPGILLVVEPNGRVGYANGQALQSLGYRADRDPAQVASTTSSTRHADEPRRAARDRARPIAATARPSRSSSRSAPSSRAASSRRSRS